MCERSALFAYGLERCGMSAVYHSVCERDDLSIRLVKLWRSCGISTRQWKGCKYINLYIKHFFVYRLHCFNLLQRHLNEHQSRSDVKPQFNFYLHIALFFNIIKCECRFNDTLG